MRLPESANRIEISTLQDRPTIFIDGEELDGLEIQATVDESTNIPAVEIRFKIEAEVIEVSDRHSPVTTYSRNNWG